MNKDAIVYFVGAGPGDPELITLKGKRLLEAADLVVYAGSLVPKAVLSHAQKAEIYDSAGLTLEEILALLVPAAKAGKMVVRLATGDPSIYGTIGEHSERLRAEGIRCEIVPGVSSFTAAAAALGRELTVPDVAQTVILSRCEGRTPVPDLEKLPLLAAHQTTLVLFLSITLVKKMQRDLLTSYAPETPCAVVYRATWPDEKIVHCALSDLSVAVKKSKITKTALVIVGKALASEGKRSKLYDPTFSHSFRSGKRLE
ncbi:MAG: precorrin-4 C(11)-methyltransferase [Nitrospirae bacterium]|nr:precorrin-4 C(11)-methyltransferase [Candidatus Manganitrophaceae bacterium]